MQRHFHQKVAVVTGASSGIGRAISIQLAEAGAKLVLAARREGPLQNLAAELSPAEALPCPADVAVPDDVRRLMEQAVKRFGRIDIEDSETIKKILVHLGLWETRNHDPPPRKVDMHKYIQDIPEIKEKVYDDFSQLTPYDDDYSQVAEEQYS